MDIETINYEYFLDLLVRMTHHSNAIEGNTLTLNETATIILDNTIPGSKSVREVFEVLNHKKAIDYMINELENEKKLDICMIKNINKEILDRLNDNAGNFKNNIYILFPQISHIQSPVTFFNHKWTYFLLKTQI